MRRRRPPLTGDQRKVVNVLVGVMRIGEICERANMTEDRATEVLRQLQRRDMVSGALGAVRDHGHEFQRPFYMLTHAGLFTASRMSAGDLP